MSLSDFSRTHHTTAPYSAALLSHYSQASMADQNNTQARPQPTSYPSPHSYPSPSMPPTYTYPPPNGHPNPDPYRSPQGSNMSLPSLNLPPIRLQDGQQQPMPQPQPQPGQQPMGSPLPPPVNHMGAYYAPPPHHPPPPGQPMNITSSPHNLAMRYQLPPQQEQRMMSGGRHKKEIKRRTKTGCLTCRKRRIKCDEAHPTCRNCQKSKRECLGYDPIFKQQPGPPQIQPAPSAAPNANSVPASAPPSSLPYNQVPQGYAPAASSGYAPAAPAVSGPNPNPPYDSFNSAIDPALDPAMQGGQPPYNGTQAPPAIKSGSPYAAASSDVKPVKAKRIKITDLLAIGGHNPPAVPARTTPVNPELDEAFNDLFSKDYCAGLNAILETGWYNGGLSKILGDKELHEEAAHFAETIKYHTSQMFDGMARIFGQEARLIWHMLALCRQSPPTTNGTNGAVKEEAGHAETEDFALKEVRARLDILEALLTNQTLDMNPAARLSYPAEIPADKKAQNEFWMHLGNFVLHENNDSAPAGAVDQALAAMRQVLQQVEARDVIYSIAIARSCGNRVPGFPQNVPPPYNNDPNNDINKLNIAVRFIADEARASTQQVISRICDMAQLSFTVSRAP